MAWFYDKQRRTLYEGSTTWVNDVLCIFQIKDQPDTSRKIISTSDLVSETLARQLLVEKQAFESDTFY